MRSLLRFGFAVGATALMACDSSDQSLAVPTPSYDAFVTEVYPVLLRDCGFPACHGTNERFYQVFGPGRARLSRDTQPYDPATDAELMLSYDRARSMLAPPEPLLVRKPLAVSAGGAGHEGDDFWGQAVYASPSDPGYRALQAWAAQAVGAP